MRPRARSLLLALATLAAGCRTTRPPEPEAGPAEASHPAAEEAAAAESTARGDVFLDGVSIRGAWRAVEVPGDARATRDLSNGRTEQTLIVGSNGRALLTSINHRARGEPVTASGRITGNRVQFAGADGAATLLMSGRRLLLRDATGRSTVFIRGGG